MQRHLNTLNSLCRITLLWVFPSLFYHTIHSIHSSETLGVGKMHWVATVKGKPDRHQIPCGGVNTWGTCNEKIHKGWKAEIFFHAHLAA